MKMSGPKPCCAYPKPVDWQCPKLNTVGAESEAATADPGIDSASAATVAASVASLACDMLCSFEPRGTWRASRPVRGASIDHSSRTSDAAHLDTRLALGTALSPTAPWTATPTVPLSRERGGCRKC